MRKQALLGAVVMLAVAFLVSLMGNPVWAKEKKTVKADGGTVAYTNLEDICRDGKKSVGKIGEIGGLHLVDCFPETIQFHTQQKCVTTLGLNPSPALYEKLKPYTFKEKLKVKFRITRTYIENNHLVGEFIAITQE